MNPKIKLRTYQSSDCLKIIKLFRDTIHSVNARDYTEAQRNAWAPENIDADAWNKSLCAHYSIVAENIGALVGFGDIDDTGYLDRLYIHKDHQGTGIATMIVDALEKHASVMGAHTIKTHASITAKLFFEKRGYYIIKEQSVPLRGQNLTNFVMEKTLQGDVTMDNAKFCQSCGMPFDDAHKELVAKEKDGSDSIYCTYCYKDGAFLSPDATVADMVEMGVPHLTRKIGEQAAREQLSQFLPTLARWNKRDGE